MTKRRQKKAIPLAPPPTMKSRKRARQVTTLFHKFTRERDAAIQRGDEELAQEYEMKIQEMGGREEYQRASQLSTLHHSTSRWVLGVLARKGWLFGIPEEAEQSQSDVRRKRKRKLQRRDMRLLEVGAINTELLDASDATQPAQKNVEGDTTVRKYRLDVRAIDLHSSNPRIEQADFLTLPVEKKYDAIVFSMVLNCVTTPEHKGLMLARLFHQLRPGGLCFLTLPKLCLSQSPYTTPERFIEMLTSGGIGFLLDETKMSPKVSFFVLRRPETIDESVSLDPKWTSLKVLNRGKKYRNQFAVVLNPEDVSGWNL